MERNILVECPKCSKPVEVDSSWAGKKAACPYCQAQFIIPGHKVEPSLPSECQLLRRPKMLWAGIICLYILFGLGLASNIVQGDINIGAICAGFLMLLGAYRMQQGSNKARVAMTIFLGLVSVVVIICLKLQGLLVMMPFIVPLIFVWLPQCNAWFREKKRVDELNGVK